jgi:hypothetical protein
VKFNQAINILMEASARDVIGQGCGIRSCTDNWREKVCEAWTIAFKYINKRNPEWKDYYNAGLPTEFCKIK